MVAYLYMVEDCDTDERNLHIQVQLPMLPENIPFPVFGRRVYFLAFSHTRFPLSRLPSSVVQSRVGMPTRRPWTCSPIA